MGAERLCGEVADPLLTKSVDVLCSKGSSRSLRWQNNCCAGAPSETNCMPKVVKIQSYKNLFRHQCSDWDRNNNAFHFWAHLERMSMYYLGDNFVFWKMRLLSANMPQWRDFFVVIFFSKKKFSSFVQIFVVSMSSDSRQQSNELHTYQSQLFKVGQAAFKVRNEIASTESHGTRSWIGWRGCSFCSDGASGIPWP